MRYRLHELRRVRSLLQLNEVASAGGPATSFALVQMRFDAMLTSAAGYPAEGTCVERAALGAPCESRPHACADGVCIDGECEAEASEAGDPCWQDCSHGLICAEGVCREPGKCEVIPGSRI